MYSIFQQTEHLNSVPSYYMATTHIRQYWRSGQSQIVSISAIAFLRPLPLQRMPEISVGREMRLSFAAIRGRALLSRLQRFVIRYSLKSSP